MFVCIYLATPLHNSAVLHDAPINMATQNLITTSTRIYYTITARNMHGMVNSKYGVSNFLKVLAGNIGTILTKNTPLPKLVFYNTAGFLYFSQQ